VTGLPWSLPVLKQTKTLDEMKLIRPSEARPFSHFSFWFVIGHR